MLALNKDNYYSDAANTDYMSVSQYKDFAGSLGHDACEYQAVAKFKGEWRAEPSQAMLIGSYVDSYFEGTLEEFKETHKEIFKKDGNLKAEYVKAEQVISRINRDDYFLKFMSGAKQTIMTGELFGTNWKIKMDSYIKDVAIVDLKVVQSISELKYVKNYGYMDFIRYWGYDIQGAIYQEIVRQNTGKQLPFYIAAASKEKETDIRVIQVTQPYLDEALDIVKNNMGRVLSVKNGTEKPIRCEKCDCCKHTRVLTAPITIKDLEGA